MTDAALMERFIADIKRHEGVRLKPYHDTVGKLTIGVGRNLDDNGISEREAEYLLANDIEVALADCHSLFTDFDDFSPARQSALVSMALNLGKPRLSGFKKMIEAVNLGRWDEAAAQALDSRWASQVGVRATEIAEALRVG